MIVRVRNTEKDLRLELEGFQREFGVPSHRLADAFTDDGRLEETPTFARWSTAFAAWKRLTGLDELDY